MTSTLLDATLCLLLVSAGVVAVSTRPGDPGSATGARPAAPADAAAETLSTSTATVNYTLAPGARPAPGSDVVFPTRRGPAFCRTAHGTLVALLAKAAMGRVTVDGDRLTHARDDLVAGVRGTVRAAVGGTHTQVVAVWRPYPGAPVGGRLTVGERPPPRADVRAATVVAASGSPPARTRPAGAATPDYRAVARTAAARTVGTLFPPAAMRFALGADYPTAALVRRRYATASRLSHASGVMGEVRRGEVRRANRRLTAALSRRFERDLRHEFDDPAAANRAVAVSRVRIVVRRWSP
ncbi:MAG: hypothetical protein ABEJ81_04140 [Haloferacaceae archaeon]